MDEMTQSTDPKQFEGLFSQFFETLFNNKPTDLNFALGQFQALTQLYGKWLQNIDWGQWIGAHLQWMQDYVQFCVHFQQALKNAKQIDLKQAHLAQENHAQDNFAYAHCVQDDKTNLQPIRFQSIDPYISPDESDRRFLNEDWHQLPLFNFWMQQYLLFTKHIRAFVASHPTPNARINKQIDIFTKLSTDALSPSNYYLTNPEVIGQIIKTNGESILQGMHNFMTDFVQNKGKIQFKMTDMEAFKVGENIATTKGKVIFQNRMMELIAYTPSTEHVHEIPLLIVPPWINKYYILDLKEKNSFVKWAVDQGFRVYMISWVNPDSTYKETTFADYMLEGVVAALEVVQKHANQKRVNTLGFCIGGTLLAATLGYLAARQQDYVQSATFLTTLIDFSDTGDVEVFIDEMQLGILNRLMEQEGVLDGRRLMLTFNLLRANDLFWSYYINNYLFGKQPFPFDLLYWNSDSVNLPYRMHQFYLENMYLKNNLVKQGEIVLDNTPIDLKKILSPSYFLSTEQDHIAPWQTTFKGAQHLGGDTTFVLGGSGHIAGVVNPPVNGKYGYKTQSASSLRQYADPMQWLQTAQYYSGSWWTHWKDWLALHSGTVIPVPKIGNTFTSLADAPGTYVAKKI